MTHKAPRGYFLGPPKLHYSRLKVRTPSINHRKLTNGSKNLNIITRKKTICILSINTNSKKREF